MAVGKALSRVAMMVPRRDVANQRQVQEAVDSTLKRLGQIDVLINLNNAGRELRGAAEEASPKQVRSVFAGNVGGLLTVTQAVVSSMRAGTRTLNWLSQQMLPLPWPVAAHRSAESGPVSYTHLDVYKRQDVDHQMRKAYLLGRGFVIELVRGHGGDGAENIIPRSRQQHAKRSGYRIFHWRRSLRG